MRSSRMVLALMVGGLVAFTGSGCAAGDEDAPSAAETVVAAFYPLAFAATEMAPDVPVRNLTPPGAEPHDLELTPGDVEDVDAARLLLYLGRGFQPALEEAVARRSGPSLDLLDGLDLIAVSAGDHADGGSLDPHVWLDPVRYAAIARAIAAALGEPTAADALVARLEALDAELANGLERCERRELVTSHAAFGYLADRYGLTQIALQGLSPEAEPSPKDLAALVDEVREEGATTVFFETLVAPDLAETVAREAGATTAVLNPLEGLTQEQVDDGADYFSVMRENLAVLREALGCT